MSKSATMTVLALLLSGCGGVKLQCFSDETGELLVNGSGPGPFPAATRLTPTHTRIDLRGHPQEGEVYENVTCWSEWG